ncbi:MAG: aspartate-semialdehyde dehydrogenase [Elusimicrobia bacterium]|nr:aspartate-semialdehyde dehydrogenase [Elusimicrobiota bacterium]
MPKKINVAVAGASGMVGGELLDLLEKRRFPVGEFLPFNSGRKAGAVTFGKKKHLCRKPSFAALKKADLVFFASTDDVSERFAKKLAAAGVWCIDDSSRFRLDKTVPLVIPEVNAAAIEPGRRLIAGPNCTLTGAAVALHDIHKKFRIEELRIATYQAVSGAGKSAMRQLEAELKYYLKRGGAPELKYRKFPHPIAFNLFPQVGGFDRNGVSVEENKVEAELKKIWASPRIKISVTAVRVPVLRGHSLSIWAKTRRRWTPAALRSTLAKTPGLEFFSDPYKYPTPLAAVKTSGVKAGRLRVSGTSPREFQLWIVSDNLYKGAALNSVEIAEYLVKNELL